MPDLKDFEAEALRNFDNFPDSALTTVRVTARLLGCSEPTVWRKIREGELETRKLSAQSRRVTIGSIRRAMGIAHDQPA